MKPEEGEVKTIARLILHAVMQTLLLAVWIVTAWTIDKLLLPRFPLEGMSMYTFRLLEFVLYLSTARVVYVRLFKRSRNDKANWWV